MKVIPIGNKKGGAVRGKVEKKMAVRETEDSDLEDEDRDGMEDGGMGKGGHDMTAKPVSSADEEAGDHDYSSEGPDAEDSGRIMDVPRSASKRKAATDTTEPASKLASMSPDAIKAWVETAVEKAVSSRLGTKSRCDMSVRNRVADLIDEFFDVLAPLHQHTDGSGSYSPGCDKCVDMDSLLSAIVEATDPGLLHTKPPEAASQAAEPEQDIII